MGKIYLAFFCLFLSTQVTAFDDVSPYVGLNAQMRRLTFMKPYGDQDFARKIKQGEVIAGLKLNPYFGLEFGYLKSIRADKNRTQAFPELLFGLPTLLRAGELTVATTHTRIESANLSFVAYLPINEDFNLLGSVGLARMHIGLDYIPTADEVGPYDADLIAEESLSFAKSKYIPTAKLGAEYMITKSVGLKALVGWDGTKRFNLLKPKQVSEARVSLKDSYNVGLGLTYYFN